MKFKAALYLVVFLSAVSSLAWGGDRIAFVVGVDSYEKLPTEAQLKVAVSDAMRIKTTLESLDPPFVVRLVADGGLREVEQAFDSFLDEAEGAECALVYFAGHGVEYHGANFLLVRDTSVNDISPDVERMKRRLGNEAVSLQAWVDSLDGTKASVKVVILDCCRDNPLKADSGGGTRTVLGSNRGLAQVTPPSGTLISYSADAGQRANDGLFTEVLAKNLRTPGLNIVKVFAKTREEVREISTGWATEDAARGLSTDFRRSRHEPAEYNKLNLAGTDFVFNREVREAEGEDGKKMSDVEIELRARELADKIVAEKMAEAMRNLTESPSVPPTAPPVSMARNDHEAGQAFLKTNGARKGVTTTSSGLQYQVLTAGDGPKPRATDEVTVHYHGTLIDGTVFDSSVDRGEPATFPLNGVIPGWTEGVQLMPQGAKYKFFIPYDLAYGERGAGAGIKPYSALVFEVELLEIEAGE